MKSNRPLLTAASPLIGVCLLGALSIAQVGKSQGVIDMNSATEKEIAALPHMTPEITKAVMNARPFDSITALNTFLLAQKLSPQQASELYAKAFVHINLNTADKDEILLIPSIAKKMTHEFKEYRPWTSWSQFDKEIGKYVGKEETARLAQYCFIPLNMNKATDEELATIPGVTKPIMEQISKGRPWKSIEDFQKELGKTAGEKDAKRIARFLVAQ